MDFCVLYIYLFLVVDNAITLFNCFLCDFRGFDLAPFETIIKRDESFKCLSNQHNFLSNQIYVINDNGFNRFY